MSMSLVQGTMSRTLNQNQICSLFWMDLNSACLTHGLSKTRVDLCKFVIICQRFFTCHSFLDQTNCMTCLADRFQLFQPCVCVVTIACSSLCLTHLTHFEDACHCLICQLLEIFSFFNFCHFYVHNLVIHCLSFFFSSFFLDKFRKHVVKCLYKHEIIIDNPDRSQIDFNLFLKNIFNV